VSITLKIDERGLREFKGAFERIMRKMHTLRVPMNAIGSYLVTRSHEHFEKEESPAGEPWKALSAKYVARPRNKGGRGGNEHPILLRTGLLMQSISTRADDKSVAIGTNRKFKGGQSAAAIHQLGGMAGRGHKAQIPARPFLGADETDVHRIGEILMDYLKNLNRE